MSREMKVNDSPNHFMILDAIGRGMTTTDKISTVTKLDKTEVELILNDLVVQRLVNRTEKKGFLRRKIEFTINETGHALLNSKKRELEQKTKDIKQAYGNGNTAQFQSFMGTDRAWIPFLVY
jgi:transcription initiation factor IIE alpha subunit